MQESARCDFLACSQTPTFKVGCCCLSFVIVHDVQEHISIGVRPLRTSLLVTSTSNTCIFRSLPVGCFLPAYVSVTGLPLNVVRSHMPRVAR